MLQNYFKIAVRNLRRRRGYALLNIFGLAMGVTCCLLIFQYVAYQKSYDAFNPQAPWVVRVRLDSYQQGQLAWKSATSYPAIGPALKKEFPEVMDYCRLIDDELLLSNPEKDIKFNEKKGYYADPSAISLLDIQLQKGDASSALNAPDKIIISQTMARKYFGQEDVVGKTLVSKDPEFVQQYLVTGVFKDYPNNSHLIIDYLVCYSSLGKKLRLEGDTENSSETAWGWYDFYTYLKLKPGTDLKKLDARLVGFTDRHINSGKWEKANNTRAALHIIPLTDIHLYSNYNQEAEVNGDGATVSFLFLIGVLILFIAWINYINLATARSIERAKEVGVRKVLGAFRSDLIRQFLTESFLLNSIALLLALLVAFLVTPGFGHYIGRSGAGGFSMPVPYWTGFIAMFFTGSFLSGIYPAFVLSGYQPVKVLKGMFKNTSTGVLLRKTLITVQFITSVVLVAGTIVVYQQLRFMRNQELGTNINQTLVVSAATALQDSVYETVFTPFRQDVLHLPNVKSITASSSVMGNEIYWTSGIRRLGANARDVTLYHLGVDYDFIPSYGIAIQAGRNFSRDFASDNKAVLLNEEAVKLLGFASDAAAISQKVIRRDTLTVIGVIADYHHEGLQKKVQPMILLLNRNTRNFYSVKMGTQNVHQSVASLQKVYAKYFPSDPFDYYFLDTAFNEQYKSDEVFQSIFTIFALLAILIACFGLSGLSSYNVLQRKKEIGVRKVLGASVRQLLILLSKDFIRLVLLAFLIAIPWTWLLMNRWLSDFAYRINISWIVFAVAGMMTVVIAFATISFQTIRAAVANPVNSLRTE